MPPAVQLQNGSSAKSASSHAELDAASVQELKEGLLGGGVEGEGRVGGDGIKRGGEEGEGGGVERVRHGGEGGRKKGVVVRVAAAVCDALERSLNRSVKDPPGKPFREGVFAPVPESGPVPNLPVVGELPACLNGEFVRNGPNAKFPPVSGYHLFDGDGMLHGVRIKDGSATYVNRYVRTAKLAQEEAWGAAKFVKMGDLSGYTGLGRLMLHGLRVRAGVLDVSQGEGTGNTALVFHNRQLLALNEGDMPYIIKILRDGEMETQGRLNYGGELDHNFTAHPKVDTVTGEMFTFGYDIEKKPHLTYRVVSKDGKMEPPVAITLPEPVMMHDFAITENFAIFMDLNLPFRPKEILKGLPFVWEPNRPARFGILPRYARTEAKIWWFELPPMFIFHTANAWEEGEEVVLTACRYEQMNLNIEETVKTEAFAQMFEFRFDLKSGKASQRKLADFGCEFPRINESLIGRKSRYAYCAAYGKTSIVGIAKFDLQAQPHLAQESTEGKGEDLFKVGGCVAGFFPFGAHRSGSEPIFVPRSKEEGTDEDDGYILTFVYDEIADKSEVVVIDAKTMAAEPAAVIKLPSRVPFGFHGIFVPEEDLEVQQNL